MRREDGKRRGESQKQGRCRRRGRERRMRGGKKENRSEAEGQQVGKMPQSFMAHRRICNTFITLLPRKAAARLISRMQAGGQRERERERERKTEIKRVMETEGTLNSLTHNSQLPWKMQSGLQDVL